MLLSFVQFVLLFLFSPFAAVTFKEYSFVLICIYLQFFLFFRILNNLIHIQTLFFSKVLFTLEQKKIVFSLVALLLQCFFTSVSRNTNFRSIVGVEGGSTNSISSC